MKTEEVRLFKNWWFLLLKGLLISSFGILFFSSYWVAILSNLPNYKVLIYTFAIITMVNGALILFGTFYYKKNNLHWMYWLMEGSFDFLLGIVGLIALGFIKIHILNMFLIQIISIWALLHGVIHFFSALRIKNYVPSSRYALFSAMLVIILSIVLFVKPIFSPGFDNLFVGVFLFVIGVLLAAISIILRRIYSD